MVTKNRAKAGSKKGKKGRIKTLTIKREAIKDVSGGEQKKVKGGGGLASSMVGASTDRSGGSRY
jgi:hypothetical protein